MPFMRMLNVNRAAFLDMIAWAEGTQIATSDNGYNVLFGATAKRPKLFLSYADHPRIRVYETHDEFIRDGDNADFTTAAGRYQITARTFDAYKIRCKVPNFSPLAQDTIALQLIRERHMALADIDAGDIEEAIRKIAPIWASMPANKEAQRHHSVAALLEVYRIAGGRVSPLPVC